MICAYQINEYLYCPRRYWYIRQGINPSNNEIEEGKQFHTKTKNRMLNNLFFDDDGLGLKGKIDYMTTKDKITLYEIKKGKSNQLWENDKFQLLAYMVLAKNNNFSIRKAYVKYGNGKKFRVKLTRRDETRLKIVLGEMREQEKIPPRCNPKKCKGCNLREYCWV